MRDSRGRDHLYRWTVDVEDWASEVEDGTSDIVIHVTVRDMHEGLVIFDREYVNKTVPVAVALAKNEVM